MRHIKLGDYIFTTINGCDSCRDLIKIYVPENLNNGSGGFVLYISGVLASKKDFDTLAESIKKDFSFLTDDDIQYSFVTNCSSDTHLNGYYVISFYIPKGLTLAEDVIIADTIDFNY